MTDKDTKIAENNVKSCFMQVERSLEIDPESVENGSPKDGQPYVTFTVDAGELSVTIYAGNHMDSSKLSASLRDNYGTNLYDYVSACQCAPLGKAEDMDADSLAKKIIEDVMKIENDSMEEQDNEEFGESTSVIDEFKQKFCESQDIHAYDDLKDEIKHIVPSSLKPKMTMDAKGKIILDMRTRPTREVFSALEDTFANHYLWYKRDLPNYDGGYRTVWEKTNNDEGIVYLEEIAKEVAEQCDGIDPDDVVEYLEHEYPEANVVDGGDHMEEYVYDSDKEDAINFALQAIEDGKINYTLTESAKKDSKDDSDDHTSFDFVPIEPNLFKEDLEDSNIPDKKVNFDLLERILDVLDGILINSIIPGGFTPYTSGHGDDGVLYLTLSKKEAFDLKTCLTEKGRDDSGVTYEFNARTTHAIGNSLEAKCKDFADPDTVEFYISEIANNLIVEEWLD